MHGQCGEVGVVAGQHHLLAGGLFARHFDHLRAVAQAPQHLRHHLRGRHAEGLGDALAAAADAGDQLLPLGADIAEQDRFRIAIDDAGDIGEIGLALADFQLIRAEALDESAQAEAVEIHGGVRCLFRACLDLRHGHFHSCCDVIKAAGLLRGPHLRRGELYSP